MGLFGVDFILNGDEVWLIEVNPRYTASVEIVERCTGVRAIVEHVAACVGGRILAESESPSAKNELGAAFHGKAILFARQDVVISSKFADYCIEESMCFPWPTLADVSPAGTPIEAGRPVLTMFAEGPSASDVEARLRARVAELERMLYAER
jgi:predicted ATP-grasp superfamily ATP-dependent carboligase